MIRVVHPGSDAWFFTHPGSWGQKGTGSRIRNTYIHFLVCGLEFVSLFLGLAVLRTRDILVRIWIRGSLPLINGSGSGSLSCYFC